METSFWSLKFTKYLDVKVMTLAFMSKDLEIKAKTNYLEFKDLRIRP